VTGEKSRPIPAENVAEAADLDAPCGVERSDRDGPS
jgi:hypothetical protein